MMVVSAGRIGDGGGPLAGIARNRSAYRARWIATLLGVRIPVGQCREQLHRKRSHGR
jgi:hypothetical protein